jgi:hypothetical protein
MEPKRTKRTRKKVVDQLGRWPAVKDVVRSNYCPYGEKKLKAMVLGGIIKGGLLDDGNRTVFVDLDSLDDHMQALCITNKHDQIKKKVAKFLESI